MKQKDTWLQQPLGCEMRLTKSRERAEFTALCGISEKALWKVDH